MTDDLILAAILEHLERGEVPDAGALARRFAGREAEVDAALRAVDRLRRVADLERHGSPHVLPGQTLGEFEVIGPHARGGMGSVYLARQRTLGRKVALKVVSASQCTATDRARFHREALCLSSVEHPHLVAVHGYGEDDGLLWIAMRYAGGPTLRQVIERHGRPRSRAERRALVGWACQIARALAAVHQQGLVHRDVKPGNIIIEDADREPPGGGRERADMPRGTATLVDFGLAQAVDLSTAELSTALHATVAYAAPEQLLGQRLGPRCDVYSLGITLHDALSGRLPGGAREATSRAEPNTSLPRLRELVPDVEADLDAVLIKATAQHEEDRYADGAEFAADLQAVLDGLPVSARKPSWRARLRQAGRDRPVRLVARSLAAAGALVLLVALSVWAVMLVGTRRAYAEAAESGDLVRIAEVLERLPPLGRLALPASGRDLRRRLERTGSRDPVADMIVHARRGDEIGALQRGSFAMAHARSGHGQLAVAFLAGRLESTLLPRGPAHGDADVANSAWTEAARLALEYEATEPSGGPFVALAAMARRALDEHGRALGPAVGLAQTVLSGWGDERDLATLVQFALSEPHEIERLRLGLSTATRIQLRRLRLGLARAEDAVDATGLLEELVPLFRAHHERHAVLGDWIVVQAGARLGAVLAVEAQLEGGAPAVAAALEAWAPDAHSSLLIVAAGLGLDAILDDAFARIPASSGDVGLGNLALAAGVLGDDALRGRLIERFGDAAHVQGHAAITERFRQGVALRTGDDREYEPDADTRLDAPPSTREPRTVTCRRVDHAALADGLPDMAWRIEDAEAAWVFGTEVPTRSGTAADPVLVDADVRRVSTVATAAGRYLRMGRFGRAEARLGFTSPPHDQVRGWTVRILAQKGARAYLPHQGVAALRISLDGNPLADAVQVDDDVPGLIRIHVGKERLHPGQRHRLTLALDGSSTTTLRLHVVAIHAVRPPD